MRHASELCLDMEPESGGQRVHFVSGHHATLSNEQFEGVSRQRFIVTLLMMFILIILLDVSDQIDLYLYVCLICWLFSSTPGP